MRGGGWNSKCGGVRRGGGEPGDARCTCSTGTRSAGSVPASTPGSVPGGDAGLWVKLGLADDVTWVDGVGVVVAVSVLSSVGRSCKHYSKLCITQVK